MHANSIFCFWITLLAMAALGQFLLHKNISYLPNPSPPSHLLPRPRASSNRPRPRGRHREQPQPRMSERMRRCIQRTAARQLSPFPTVHDADRPTPSEHKWCPWFASQPALRLWRSCPRERCFGRHMINSWQYSHRCIWTFYCSNSQGMRSP